MAGLGGLHVSGTGHLGSVLAPASFPPHDHLRYALHMIFISGRIASRTPLLEASRWPLRVTSALRSAVEALYRCGRNGANGLTQP